VEAREPYSDQTDDPGLSASSANAQPDLFRDLAGWLCAAGDLLKDRELLFLSSAERRLLRELQTMFATNSDP
jgi:hypothetical protein